MPLESDAMSIGIRAMRSEDGRSEGDRIVLRAAGAECAFGIALE